MIVGLLALRRQGRGISRFLTHQASTKTTMVRMKNTSQTTTNIQKSSAMVIVRDCVSKTKKFIPKIVCATISHLKELGCYGFLQDQLTPTKLPGRYMTDASVMIFTMPLSSTVSCWSSCSLFVTTLVSWARSFIPCIRSRFSCVRYSIRRVISLISVSNFAVSS
jgi:hypothetical protein